MIKLWNKFLNESIEFQNNYISKDFNIDEDEIQNIFQDLIDELGAFKILAISMADGGFRSQHGFYIRFIYGNSSDWGPSTNMSEEHARHKWEISHMNCLDDYEKLISMKDELNEIDGRLSDFLLEITGPYEPSKLIFAPQIIYFIVRRMNFDMDVPVIKNWIEN